MDNRKDEKSRTLCATSEEGLKARGRRCDLLLLCDVCLCVALCVAYRVWSLAGGNRPWHGGRVGKSTTNPSKQGFVVFKFC